MIGIEAYVDVAGNSADDIHEVDGYDDGDDDPMWFPGWLVGRTVVMTMEVNLFPSIAPIVMVMMVRISGNDEGDYGHDHAVT